MPWRMDAAGAVDAKSASTAPRKTAQTAVSHSAHTHHQSTRSAHEIPDSPLAGLMWPAITRMPLIAPNPARMFGLLIALVVALPVRDYLVRRRLHPASTWGAIMILMSFPVRVAIGNSALWHLLASRIIAPS